MEEHFKIIAVRLWAEIRKDLCFFASCGFIVGLLTVWQYTLKERGVAHGESWPDALFSDFVSFNAFGFIFCGLLLIGSFATVMNALGCQWPRLESAVAHLENRFAQLTKCLRKINFIFNSKLLQNVFNIFHHMEPAFICPQFYPFILHKAP